MTNYASLRGPVGIDRVYVQSGLPLTGAAWYAALKAGKSFATNGPLLQFRSAQTDRRRNQARLRGRTACRCG